MQERKREKEMKKKRKNLNEIHYNFTFSFPTTPHSVKYVHYILYYIVDGKGNIQSDMCVMAM